MITPNQIAKVIVKILTGKDVEKPSIIKINHQFLEPRSTKLRFTIPCKISADLSFPLAIRYWTGYIGTEACRNKDEFDYLMSMKDIVTYFGHRYMKCKNLSDEKLLEEFKKCVIDEIKCIDEDFSDISFTIHSNKLLLINYNKSISTYIAIKTVIEQKCRYGIKQGSKKAIKIEVENDDESELTNMRLNLIRKVSENLLKLQNYDVQDIQAEECTNTNNYLYTTKSEDKLTDSYTRLICGVVLNTNNKKEKNLKQDTYLLNKTEKIRELCSQRCFDINVDQKNSEENIRKIANASIAYELLSTKRTHPIIIDNSNNLDRFSREASFILYNIARIKAIFSKYENLLQKDSELEVYPLNKMEFKTIIKNEDSWLLIYNYIIRYPDMLDTAITVEPILDINIHLIWLFISNLCHDFSKYYRRNKILTEKYVHEKNDVLQETSEKLHMLKALYIILCNLLSLLDIEEVSHM